MKKLLLFVSASLIASWAISQGCVNTIPSTVITLKVDGTHVGSGDQIWVCENLVIEIQGGSNTVYVEKGGDITVTGDGQNRIFMKAPGTLTINSDNSPYTVDSAVVVVDNGTGNTFKVCNMSDQPLEYDYVNAPVVLDCIDTSTVGIYSIGVLEGVNLYPNPVVDVLTIDLPVEGRGSEYNIYSISGKKVLSGRLEEKSSQIDLTSLEEGLYFIEIENRHGKVSKRISVE